MYGSLSLQIVCIDWQATSVNNDIMTKNCEKSFDVIQKYVKKEISFFLQKAGGNIF